MKFKWRLKEKLKALADKHKEVAAEIEKIEKENLETTNEIYKPTSSKIIISGTIYPGVKIGINGRFLKITEPMKAKTFSLSEDDEVVAS